MTPTRPTYRRKHERRPKTPEAQSFLEPPSAEQLRTPRFARAGIIGALLLGLVVVLVAVLIGRSLPQETSEPSVTAVAQEADLGIDGVPSFLGGPSRRLEGFGPAPRSLQLKWRVRIGSGLTSRKSDDKLVAWSGTGWTGQPTIMRTKKHLWLYVGGYDHRLHKIDAQTGKVEWEAEWPDVMKGTNTIVKNPSPSKGEPKTIVVSGSRRGSKYEIGDPRIAPLRAVSATTGKLQWRLPVPKTANYSQDVDASPLWYRNVLYAAVESGYVYALDPFKTVKKKGKNRPAVLARSPKLYDKSDVIAHPDTGGANLSIEGSPAAIGDTIYVTTGSGHIYGLDRKSLKIVWNFETGTDIDSTPVVTDDGRLLVALEEQYSDREGGAYLLDPTKPPKDSIVWYYPTPSSGFGEWEGGSVGSVSISDGGEKGSKPRLVALNTVDGMVRLVSLDTMTAKRLKGPGARRPAPAPVEVFTDTIGGSISTPIIVGDMLVTAGFDQKVRLYEIRYTAARKGQVRAVQSPNGRWWTVSVRLVDTFSGKAAFESTPLVYGGRVFIGCRDGYLYCLGD